MNVAVTMAELRGFVPRKAGELGEILLAEVKTALGASEECSLVPTAEQKHLPVVNYRFAEVVYLKELKAGRTAFDVYLGERKATERIGFDHQFE